VICRHTREGVGEPRAKTCPAIPQQATHLIRRHRCTPVGRFHQITWVANELFASSGICTVCEGSNRIESSPVSPTTYSIAKGGQDRGDRRIRTASLHQSFPSPPIPYIRTTIYTKQNRLTSCHNLIILTHPSLMLASRSSTVAAGSQRISIPTTGSECSASKQGLPKAGINPSKRKEEHKVGQCGVGALSSALPVIGRGQGKLPGI
jgi:hypothetical protein